MIVHILKCHGCVENERAEGLLKKILKWGTNHGIWKIVLTGWIEEG